MVEQGLPFLSNSQALSTLSPNFRHAARQFVGLTIWKSREDAEKYVNRSSRQVLESIRPILQHEADISLL